MWCEKRFWSGQHHQTHCALTVFVTGHPQRILKSRNIVDSYFVMEEIFSEKGSGKNGK